MKPSLKARSAAPKILLVLIALIVLVSADYYVYAGRLERVDRYDDLSRRLSSIRTMIIKLEYTLDMFVVARRFEDTTVALIKKDIVRLDKSVSGAVGNPRYSILTMENAPLADGFASIAEDWVTIKDEVARLNEAMSQEEVMLIHNAVDVNTILVNEMADRLIEVIAEGRSALMRALKVQALATIAGFFFICFVLLVVFYRWIFTLLKRITETALSIATGEIDSRFEGSGGGLVGTVAASINRMLDFIVDEYGAKDKKIRKTSEELERKAEQIKAIGRLTSFAGNSIAKPEIYSAAVRAAVELGGAGAAAVYSCEGGTLTLSSSNGFDRAALERAESIGDPGGGTEPVVFGSLGEIRDERLRRLLDVSGMNTLLAAPIRTGGRTTGWLLAAYSDHTGNAAASVPFIGAMTAQIGVFAGYIGLFQREYDARRFLERVVNQVPFGVAVFDMAGTCTMANSSLRRYLGAGPDDRLVGEYRIAEDDVFVEQGLVPSIKKAYEGYATEFIINYNPALLSRYRLGGSPRLFKIRSIPLYDSGGEIKSIILLYEDLTDSTGASAGEAIP